MEQTEHSAGPDPAIITRIQNLLKMTEENGCTENEAAVALQHAYRLMQKHNLEMADVETTSRHYVTEEEADPGLDFGRPQAWAPPIASALARLYGLVVISRGRPYGRKSVVFIGEPTNAKTASVQFLWIIEQAKRLVKARWDAQPRRDGSGYTLFENSYFVGFKEGIIYQIALLIREREARTAGEDDKRMTAIVAVRNQEAEEYMKEQYPDLGKAAKARAPRAINPSAYVSGATDGMKATLDRTEPLGAQR